MHHKSSIRKGYGRNVAEMMDKNRVVDPAGFEPATFAL